MPRLKSDIRIKNKKAEYQFFLIDRYTAGIVLTGTEIKSIRAGKASVGEAFCVFLGNELFIKNMYVAEYSHGSAFNHVPRRDRKLLLNKRELRKLQGKIKEKGLTIIPVVLFIDENGRAKMEIALAKGKKLYDKRETLKEKDIKRQMQRGREE
ncbi:MAG: SsrA-binding protein SmpB [Bacteroides sp.]|nr:SsrA-binding protein SmpB [Bacteroides sp.]MCM1085259.1 SsrA-binding protein SmpB [Bacteroides sp.]MCM1168694.1 SsrA-binding protein SmpB [Bacteroides sp.]